MPVISYDCSALTPNGFSGADVSAIFKKVREVTRSGPLFEWMRRDSDRPGSSDGKFIVYVELIQRKCFVQSLMGMKIGLITKEASGAEKMEITEGKI